MVPHEREECEWAVVECSYQCGAHLPRRLMAEHEQDLCPQRPMDVKLECFMKLMETRLTTERERHEREMTKMEKDHTREIAAVKSEMSEFDKRHESKMEEEYKRDVI